MKDDRVTHAEALERLSGFRQCGVTAITALLIVLGVAFCSPPPAHADPRYPAQGVYAGAVPSQPLDCFATFQPIPLMQRCMSAESAARQVESQRNLEIEIGRERDRTDRYFELLMQEGSRYGR